MTAGDPSQTTSIQIMHVFMYILYKLHACDFDICKSYEYVLINVSNSTAVELLHTDINLMYGDLIPQI